MAGVSPIVSRGFGTWGSANLATTAGYASADLPTVDINLTLALNRTVSITGTINRTASITSTINRTVSDDGNLTG